LVTPGMSVESEYPATMYSSSPVCWMDGA